jgi:2-polyprenyl-3-methyl-5-hydroxy-6-metoxy-1,4-benzoquinol methylase
MQCTICKNNDFEQVYRILENSITSDSLFIDKKISNLICKSCGHVFNEYGSRNETIDFFSTKYKLHEETKDAEFKFFSNDGKSITHQDIRLSLLKNNTQLPITGKILDLGCGKGNFLSAFSKKYPHWEIYGVEISDSACNIAKNNISKLHLHQGHFTKKVFNNLEFDLIVSHGVLEHLEHPDFFLKDASSKLKKDGLFFFEVPNFKLNPSDLYTFDHLSHFTKETFENLLNTNHIQIIKIFDSMTQISLYSICKHTKEEIPFKNYYSFMKNLVDDHIKFNESFFNLYESICKKFKNIGIFGLGLIGLSAIQNSKLHKNQIKLFFDENDLLVGTKKLGIKIIHLNDLQYYESLPITISASPCYIFNMITKLKQFKIKFFVPDEYQYYKKYFPSTT